jgi:hypothetical protein
MRLIYLAQEVLSNEMKTETSDHPRQIDLMKTYPKKLLLKKPRAMKTTLLRAQKP